MGFFDRFNKKNNAGKNAEKIIQRDDVFHAYSDMRVEVTNENGNMLFNAYLKVSPMGEVTLKQISDYDITYELTDLEESSGEDKKFIKANIRGYFQDQKKAIYLEGNIYPAEEKIWSTSNLRVAKVVNDRAFFRLDAIYDATMIPLDLNDMEERNCRVINISIGGVKIVASEFFNLGVKFVLVVKLLPELPDSKICCEVVRIEDKSDRTGEKFEYGCKFTDLSEADQAQIAKNIFQAELEKRR